MHAVLVCVCVVCKPCLCAHRVCVHAVFVCTPCVCGGCARRVCVFVCVVHAVCVWCVNGVHAVCGCARRVWCVLGGGVQAGDVCVCDVLCVWCVCVWRGCHAVCVCVGGVHAMCGVWVWCML